MRISEEECSIEDTSVQHFPTEALSLQPCKQHVSVMMSFRFHPGPWRKGMEEAEEVGPLEEGPSSFEEPYLKKEEAEQKTASERKDFNPI